LNGEDTEADTPSTTAVFTPVRTTTLDRICTDRGWSDVALVKLDIEGAELAALRGAESLLSGALGKPPIVAVEYSQIIPTIGGKPEDIFALFATRGWRAYRLANGKEGGGDLHPIESADQAPRHDNVIFVPPERAELSGSDGAFSKT
jgi:hypothetical protein